MKQLIILAVLGMWGTLVPFASLKQASSYAKANAEFPPLSGLRYLRPDYDKFHRGRVPGLLQRYIGRPAWSAQKFSDQLSAVTRSRLKSGFQEDMVVRLSATPQSSVVVFGDVHGAFHSLVRGLEKLKAMQVLDDNLRVIKDDTYIVFNGNVPSRSPYILEALTLVLALMQRNPQRVFYVRGGLELPGNWYEFGLKQELRIRARHLSQDRVPLERELNRFFATLPLALYIDMAPKGEKQYIKIDSLSPFAYPKVATENVVDYLRTAPEEGKHIDRFYVASQRISPFDVTLGALITSLPKAYQSIEFTGLTQLPPLENASIAWAVFSSPTDVSKRVLDFHNDSFAIIDAAQKPQDWTITHYYREARGAGEFNTRSYELLSAKRLLPG